jgi:hypothetical protein
MIKVRPSWLADHACASCDMHCALYSEIYQPDDGLRVHASIMTPSHRKSICKTNGNHMENLIQSRGCSEAVKRAAAVVHDKHARGSWHTWLGWFSRGSVRRLTKVTYTVRACVRCARGCIGLRNLSLHYARAFVQTWLLSNVPAKLSNTAYILHRISMMTSVSGLEMPKIDGASEYAGAALPLASLCGSHRILCLMSCQDLGRRSAGPCSTSFLSSVSSICVACVVLCF